MNRKSLPIFITALTLLLTLAQWSGAQPNPFRRSRSDDKAAGFRENPKMVAAFHDVVAAPAKSVVRVQCAGKNVALGTIVDAEGFILTKYSELLPDTLTTVILKDGRTLAARIVGVEPKYDLAMLQVHAADLIPVQWGQSKSAMVGELLASPGTGEQAVAVGVLSVAARSVRGRDFATPPPDSGFLGVMLEEDKGGARIIQIVAKSPALKAGLQVGDIVTLVAKTPVTNSETMVQTIQKYKAGDVVEIKLKRADKELTVKATLEKRTPEANRRDFQNQMGSELSEHRSGFPQIIQHDMVLKPHECGGPVVDLDGKAIGINIARAGRVESYAIPAEAVQKLIPDLKSGKLALNSEPTTKPVAAKPATTRPSNTSAPAK